MKAVDVGYQNIVPVARIIAVLNLGKGKVLRRLAREAPPLKLIDVTAGRKARSLIITDTDHVIVSVLKSETVAERIEG